MPVRCRWRKVITGGRGITPSPRPRKDYHNLCCPATQTPTQLFWTAPLQVDGVMHGACRFKSLAPRRVWEGQEGAKAVESRC